MTIHESEFEIDGTVYKIEWEMDGNTPVWNIEGEDTCGGPNLPKDIRDKIDAAVFCYMEDYFSEDY